MSENPWSDWLDFNQDTINSAPESPGVFMMHASMKVLFINSSDNIKTGLADAIKNSCIAEASRVRYMKIKDHEKTKTELIEDYKTRHDGNLPRCMQE